MAIIYNTLKKKKENCQKQLQMFCKIKIKNNNKNVLLCRAPDYWLPLRSRHTVRQGGAYEKKIKQKHFFSTKGTQNWQISVSNNKITAIVKIIKLMKNSNRKYLFEREVERIRRNNDSHVTAPTGAPPLYKPAHSPGSGWQTDLTAALRAAPGPDSPASRRYDK